MRSIFRRTCTILASVAIALPMLGSPPPASAAPAAIGAGAFGMHWLNPGPQYPTVRFGSARVWDMGVTWAELQPRSSATSTSVLTKLDGIVATFRAHHVDPMITLGMTPRWAAR